MSNLPTKANLIYGVGIPNSYKSLQDHNIFTKNVADYKQLIALKNKFKVYKFNYEHIKELSKKRELDVIDYADVLLGICANLCLRNCLTYNRKKTKLNKLGEHIKKIKNIVNYSEVIEVGLLNQFYTEQPGLIDTVESILKNYYNSLSLDFRLTPNQKHSEIVEQLNLNDINWGELKTELKESLEVNEAKKIAKSLFIVEQNFDNLKVKMTLNLISQTEYEYFKYLDLEGNLSVHLLDLFYSILKFDLIGSTIRVYLALLIESLISIVIYIKSFPEELLHTPWEMFSFYDTYLEEKQKICKYLNLAIEISYIFSKFRIFEEMGDINKALFKDYQTLSQYLYNNQITNEYSLRVYYDGI